MLVKPESAVPRVDVTVDLLSRVMRPYLFRVIATGHPPHAQRREYMVRAVDEDQAAYFGIDQFIREFTLAQPVRDMETLAPRAIRQ